MGIGTLRRGYATRELRPAPPPPAMIRYEDHQQALRDQAKRHAEELAAARAGTGPSERELKVRDERIAELEALAKANGEKVISLEKELAEANALLEEQTKAEAKPGEKPADAPAKPEAEGKKKK